MIYDQNICKQCRENPVRILSNGTMSEFCSRKCSGKFNAINSREKSRLTCLEKYGVDNPSKSQTIKSKKIETCQKNFGVDYPGQSLIVNETCRKTCMIRYGTNNPMQNIEVRNNKDRKFLEKYGVDNPSKLQGVKDAISVANTENYKLNKDVILHKRNITNLEKYGVEWNSQRPEHRILCNITSNERYGTDWPMQNDDIHSRSTHNSKLLKKYTFPSGRVEKVQGYEPWALDLLIKNYHEDDIVLGRKNIPRIKYLINGVKSIYKPDIYIPKDNLLIEVKSVYTYNIDLDKNLIKKSACILSGFNFKFMIFDVKGVLLNDN